MIYVDVRWIKIVSYVDNVGCCPHVLTIWTDVDALLEFLSFQ